MDRILNWLQNYIECTKKVQNWTACLVFCFSGDRIPNIEYTADDIATWDAVYNKVHHTLC